MIENLTAREREILKSCSWPTEKIAEKMKIKKTTISKHFQNIFEKTKTQTRAELLVFALKNELLTISEVIKNEL